MTGKELKGFFEEHLVPKKLYKIGGSHNNRICLEKRGNAWAVYYSEHKARVGELLFQDESAACSRMKDEIRKVMEQVYGVTWAPAFG